MRRLHPSKPVIEFLLIIWAIVSIFPLYWLITFSLKDNYEIFGGNVIGLPRQWLFGNYRSALINGKAGIYLKNSIVVTGCTILLTIILSPMATYALNRMVWRGRRAMNAFFMLGLMIPIHAALLPLLLVMRTLRLTSTPWALVLPYTGFALSMGILIIGGFIGGIPREMEEAAFIDGASIYRTFFLIIMPMLTPAIATVMIFTFLSAWNELLFAQVFMKESSMTLTAGIQAMYGQYQTDWGPIGAALVVATLPVLIIYLLMSSQVQKSLAAGAVKG